MLQTALTKSTKCEMQDLREQLERAEGKILELEHQLRSQSDIINILQERQESNLDSIDKLKQESNEAEQYSRRTCVRVYDVPENPGEDTDKLVLDLAR